jgi:hypothetical protein
MSVPRGSPVLNAEIRHHQPHEQHDKRQQRDGEFPREVQPGDTGQIFCVDLSVRPVVCHALRV